MALCRPACLALAGAILAAALAGCAATPDEALPAARVTFAQVASFDGHRVPVTLYRPAGASDASPVPVVLHTHGWGGSRETRLGAFTDHTDAGLAVVSMDMRGHGEARASSASSLADPDVEVRDVAAVLDHVAGLGWVLLEAPGDPRAGFVGESFGGGMALLSAAHDSRIDAVAAQDTWHDLSAALVPEGVPKAAWIASLWLSGGFQGRLHEDVRATFERVAARPSAEGLAAAQAFLRDRSVAHAPQPVRVPTLLVQGVNDTLFDLGQAVANERMVREAGGATALATHLGGHVLATGRPYEGQDPCGDPDALALAWMRQHLLGGADQDVPAVCVTFDDGTTLRASSWPPAGSPLAVPLADVRVRPGNVSAAARVDVALGGAGARLLGEPRLSGVAGPDAAGVVYARLERVDPDGTWRVANGQVHPVVLRPGPFDVALAPVAVHLPEGHGLRLAFLGHDPLFAPPSGPPGAAVDLSDLRLTIPTV